MRIYLNALVVAVVSCLWSYTYYADGWTQENFIRPFVYRQLVPLLTRAVEFVGVPANVALILVMTVSGVGFYLALRKLALEFYNLSDWQEIYLVAGVLVSLVALGEYRKPYDLMTAWLFTLFFYYFWTDQKAKHLLVFALACLNRETAILLVLFYLVYLFSMRNKGRNYEIIWMLISQVYLYVLITAAVRLIFADSPGVVLSVDPAENFLIFADQPYHLISHILFVLVLQLVMSEGWEQKPLYLRDAFRLLAPLLVVMYLVCGQAFEIRVFWEIAPLVILLSMPKS